MGLVVLLLHYPYCLFIGFGERIEVGMSIEEMLEKLESCANFMNGMRFDPRIPVDVKQALCEKSQEIYDFVEDAQNDD